MENLIFCAVKFTQNGANTWQIKFKKFEVNIVKNKMVIIKSGWNDLIL